jgi:hypothetical protein
MQNEKLRTYQGGSTTSAPSQEKATAESEQQPVTVSDTLLGTDPPLEKAHPGLQPALVFAAYPLAFIVIISCIAVYYMITQSNPTADEAYPNAPASVGSSQR